MCLWLCTIVVHSVHPYSNNDQVRYQLRPTPTTLFHLRGQNLATELSLWLGQSCGTVCQRQLATRTVYTLLNAFSNRTFFSFWAFCFNDWQCNALQVRFRAWRGTKLPSSTFTSTWYGTEQFSYPPKQSPPLRRCLLEGRETVFNAK